MISTLSSNQTDRQKAGSRILGTGGPIARTLPGYEPRQPQIEMADLVDDVIASGTHALIEAGTGTGKSLGYLIPAILSGKRVVVSTDTIQLQEQLVQKDLPYLAEILQPFLGREIRFAIAKGRSNYGCERNMETFLKDTPSTDVAFPMVQDTLRLFQRGEWDGDKSTLSGVNGMTEARWSLVNGDDSCTGKSCPNAGRCAYMAAKARFEEADVVVTNHTMYFLHHLLMERTGGIVGALPDHTVWIADEAHTLSDKCCDQFGTELSHRSVPSFLKKLFRQIKTLKLDIPSDAIKSAEMNAANAAAMEAFWKTANQEQLLSEYPEELWEDMGRKLLALAASLRPVRVALANAARHVDPDDQPTKGAVERLQQTARELIDCIENNFLVRDGNPWDPEAERGPWRPFSDPDYVVYAEVASDGQGGKEVTLHCKPIETASIFRRIYGKLDAVVFTSATLSCGEGVQGWRPVAEELGMNLAGTATMQVDSPFDYDRQVVGYLPDPALPVHQSPDYHMELAGEVMRVLTWSQERNAAEGRKWGAFVLFASFKDLNRVYDLIIRTCPFPIYKQGMMPKDEMIRSFQSDENPVLFGVKTFWTGVDIKGDQLSCVVIPRLPFPNPSQPLVKARCARIEAAGRSSFFEFSLPRAIRDLKQGFGRLIRSRDDQGVFALLDSKCHPTAGARYRHQVYASLPEFSCIHRLDDGMRQAA